MEDRLKGLRHSMKKTIYSDLQFTEDHQLNILKKINEQKESEEDVLLAIMQLLVQERTGYELTTLLRGRGIRKFEDNEGFLYTMLHRLEQNNCLRSRWEEAGAKQYQLSDKGRKLLRRAEKKQTNRQLISKEIWEG